MPPSPPAYKHFCRVCNKGFTCGSALGGHMRAHGVGDDGFGAVDDDDEPVTSARGGADGAWDTAGTSAAAGPASTHVYALRANPNRLIRSCQVCKNCGKEFASMELFLEHGKCNSGDEEDVDADGSLHLSPPSVAGDEEDDASLAAGWSKGKRSRRAKLIAAGGADDLPTTAPSSAEEEQDLANCLVLLSSSRVDQATVAEADQEPCASASKEQGKRPQLVQPFSFVVSAPDPAMVMPLALPAPQYVSPMPRGMFECKACKKVFTSHQALGGHRASHKKVKGCFAAKPYSNVSEPPGHAAAADLNDDKGNAATVEVSANVSADVRTNFDASTGGDANAGTSEAAASLSMAIATTGTDHEPPVTTPLAIAPFKKKAKMHECSVCHRLFSSGQALGGHKRCHWLTSSTGDHANLTPLAAEGLVSAAGHQLTLRPLANPSEPALDLTIAANPLPVMATARVAEVGNSSLHLDASASLYLQPSAVPSNASHQTKVTVTSSHNVNDTAGAAVAGDEADSTSTVKKARLSDLKDVSTPGETTPWLQVGIGSSSTGGDEKSTRE